MFKSSRAARISHLFVWGYNSSIGGSTKESKKIKRCRSKSMYNKKKTDRWDVTIGLFGEPKTFFERKKKKLKRREKMTLIITIVRIFNLYHI